MGVAHLALDLGPGHECGHRVDDHDVEGARADQHVGDLERLLARVGLGDQQLVDVDADRRRVDRVHGVLGVDVGAGAAVALGLGHHVHGEGGLARGLRTEDLDDATAGQAPDAERDVERQRAGGDGGDTDVAVLAEAHDGALAVLLLDLAECHFECLVSFHGGTLLWVASTVRSVGGKSSWGPYDRGVTVIRACSSGLPRTRGLRSRPRTTQVQLSRTPVRFQACSRPRARRSHRLVGAGGVSETRPREGGLQLEEAAQLVVRAPTPAHPLHAELALAGAAEPAVHLAGLVDERDLGGEATVAAEVRLDHGERKGPGLKDLPRAGLGESPSRDTPEIDGDPEVVTSVAQVTRPAASPVLSAVSTRMEYSAPKERRPTLAELMPARNLSR